VQIADTKAKTVTHTIPVGSHPAGTAMSPDGELLFVSCASERRVYVISLADGEVLSIITTGEGPGALACVDLAEVA
jgi:DNA-binding beta-propeller fold protein YncE